MTDPAYQWPIHIATSATLIRQRMTDFHDHILLWVMGGVALLVFLLMVYIVLRYNARANPVPAKFTHNVPLEVIWTLIPVIILIFVGIPSFKLLYYMDKAPGKPEVVIKVTGHQWYWEYAYPDAGNFSFNANIVEDKDLQPVQPRLLTTDNHIVIPVNTNVQFLVTAADVLHAFMIPEFGINVLAVPGRTNEVWANATREGIYYGQCNKICGVNHSKMPIMIEVVSREKYQQWLLDAKKKYSLLSPYVRIQAQG
jgi:cytochrome c oxidase subunit 2